MTADIKQLADLARDKNQGLPLLAFGHSMGPALTQAHIQNHSDLLAGAILCGTLGAVPGVDEDDYPGVIAQLHALRAGAWRLHQDIRAGVVGLVSKPEALEAQLKKYAAARV